MCAYHKQLLEFFLIIAVALFLFLFQAGAVEAVEPDEVLTDVYLEERARTISKGLRCLVCVNETIDESQAPLARDLRLLVRERLVKGDSDDEIVDFIVSRYGEFVLLRPIFSVKTALLWLSPVLILAIVFTIIFCRILSYKNASYFKDKGSN